MRVTFATLSAPVVGFFGRARLDWRPAFEALPEARRIAILDEFLEAARAKRREVEEAHRLRLAHEDARNAEMIRSH